MVIFNSYVKLPKGVSWWRIYIYIYISIYPSIHPSIHPSIYLSLYLSLSLHMWYCDLKCMFFYGVILLAFYICNLFGKQVCIQVPRLGSWQSCHYFFLFHSICATNDEDARLVSLQTAEPLKPLFGGKLWLRNAHVKVQLCNFCESFWEILQEVWVMII